AGLPVAPPQNLRLLCHAEKPVLRSRQRKPPPPEHPRERHQVPVLQQRMRLKPGTHSSKLYVTHRTAATALLTRRCTPRLFSRKAKRKDTPCILSLQESPQIFASGAHRSFVS